MNKNGVRAWAYKYVDKIMANEAEIREAIISVRNDVHHERIGGSGQAYVSDPTANTALANVKPVEYVVVRGQRYRCPEKWLSILAHIKAQCGDIEREVYDAKYLRKLGVEQALDELHISRTTYFNIVDGIKGYAVELGCQEGLLMVCRLEGNNNDR